MLNYLDDNSLAFPDPEFALQDPNGLLAVGGDLTPDRLKLAYNQGIFPWFSEGEPILWWSPDPRGVILLDNLYINKTLKKFIRKSPFRLSVNKAFTQVIQKCASAPFRDGATWILPNMLSAYIELHKQGHAHSIEVWQDDELVGGLYGVATNGFFSGESMFYSENNASKLALIALSRILKENGINFIDCQLLNPFLAAMGCTEIARQEFLSLKNSAINTIVDKDMWTPRELTNER